jgi:uncharacterized repeat protein (TIGR01451 family)
MAVKHMKNIAKKLVLLSFVFAFFASAAGVQAVGAPYTNSASATNITSTSAKLNAVVNPNGSNTNAWFETTNNGPALGFQNIGGGTQNVTLQPYTLTGLNPNTAYQFHVVSQNSYGNTVSSWIHFTTTGGNNPPPPPLELPSVDLSANSTNLPYGGSTTIYWDAYNATSCTASGGSNGWAGYKNPNGGSFNTGALYSDKTYSITCSNGSGSDSDSLTINVADEPYNPPSAPSVNLTANPSSVAYGGSSTLSWNSTNATSCTASGAWSGTKPTSGTFYTGNLTSTKTYNITCTGAGGSAVDSVTVTVGNEPYNPPTPSPTVNLNANPTSVQSGGSSVLSWNSTNATSCTATGGMNGWAGPKATSGTFYANNLTYSSTYSLTCTNSSGSTTDSVTINVSQTPPPPSAPSVDLTANPMNVVYGGSSTLSWNSSNANSCVASGAWSGTKPTSGTFYTGALTSTQAYTLTCGGNGGSASDAVTVYVGTNNDDDNDDDDNNTDKPEVTTDSANSISNTSATLNGELEDLGGDDEADVWFEYSDDRDEVEDDDGEKTDREDMDDEDDFSDRITGLRSNTTYYYRAVARNSEGTDYGSIRSFRTTGGSVVSNGCTSGFCAPQAITTLATSIGNNSARLNGLGIINDNAQTNAYFEWGPNLAMNNNTPAISIGNSGSNPYSANIFGLASNTTYYFRAVVTNQFGNSYGDIASFRTSGSTGGGSVAGSSTTIIRNNSNTSSTTVVGGTARPSLVFLSISHNDETIRHGEIVEYVVNYRNISKKNLKDVVIRVVLPKELKFIETSRGYFSETNNTVVVNVGDLYPDEEGSVFVTAQVLSTAEAGKITVVTANLAYTIVIDNTQEEVFAYSKNTIGDGFNLGASALFGVGFLPDSLFGWLLLLLIILLILLAARMAYNHGRPQHQTIVMPQNGSGSNSNNTPPFYGATPPRDNYNH